VTEMVTGLDLVRLQIEVARGEKLKVTQEDVQLRGHAIEVRVYAEDVLAGFLPSTGTLEVWRPASGPGLREDTGMFEGAEISRFYDPMISKLVAYGENRAAAIDRMCRALREYYIAGVMNNIGFCHFVLKRDEFRSGKFDTGTVERILLPAYREYVNSGEDIPDWLPAAIAVANRAYRSEVVRLSDNSNGTHGSGWKRAGRAKSLRNR
jgi:acetyl-CoA carboxylase, biotin carboxylase subunit